MLTKLDIGLAINSTLFTVGCFVAGLVTQHGIAWRLALAAFGVRTLAFMAEALRPSPAKPRILTGLGLGATLIGAFAGLCLIW